MVPCSRKHNMAAIKFTHECDEKIGNQFDTPSEHVISEGELLIKALAEKQANRIINLEDQLNQKKEFQKSTFVPVTAFASGKTTLEEFKKCTEFVHSIEELKSLGLTQKEIELFNDSKEGNDFLYTKHRNVCKATLEKQIQELHGRIVNLKAAREQVTEKNEDNIPRHLKDLAFCVKPDSQETKLYKFALKCASSKPDIIPDHPINNLKQLERELFEHLDSVPVPPLKKRRKKAIKYIDERKEPEIIQSKSYAVGESKWDKRQVPLEKCTQRKCVTVKTYTCKPQQLYTIRNDKIVRLNDLKNEERSSNTFNGKKFIAGEQSAEGDVEKEKLSEEEIKKIPRFQDYERGEPSKVLYVKNLASSVKKEDLISVFSKYDKEKEKIVYRLLSGRMRGQAFLTFYNINQATKCLEATNGIILKGKPIIVQYGKKKT